MSWTYNEAKEFYDEAKKGYKAALHLQEYSVKEREAKRAKLETLETALFKWKGIMDSAESGTSGCINGKRGVPTDD